VEQVGKAFVVNKVGRCQRSMYFVLIMSRIIEGEGNPFWEETTALLVGPAELNAQEQLMLQLWDSGGVYAQSLND
jgi:hypothetical protein